MAVDHLAPSLVKARARITTLTAIDGTVDRKRQDEVDIIGKTLTVEVAV
jgi:hypothetical protein